jgi:signal transduction histidine kinase
LDRLGLTRALDAMIQRVAASSGMRLEARLTPIDDLFADEDEITLFRVVQESMNNIVKHSQASEGVVTVDRQGGMVTITIRDNGRGFEVHRSAVSENGGFGLAGMAERVRILGGVHRIQSVPGEGTTVTITIDTSKARGKGSHVHSDSGVHRG